MPIQVFSDGADAYAVRAPGDYTLEFLAGDDALTVAGGTATTAAMGDGNDIIRLLSGMASVDGGLGADRFDIWAPEVSASGGAGDDLFVLRAGSGQTITGGDGSDRVNLAANITDLTADLGAGRDAFVGSGFSVTGKLYSGDGNDSFVDLVSGGNLTLYGGEGNDTYRVSGTSRGGVIVEYAGEGIDTVQLARGMDYVLGDNLERVVIGTYAGSTPGAATITGNALANGITGSGNAETMLGLGGNDHLNGKAGDDVLWGGDGNDALDGGLGNDRLQGEAGNDALIGRQGDDIMAGGAGNDTYYVDSVGDVVIENGGEGTDAVRTTVDLTLPDNVENGVVANAAGLTLYGNGLDNHLYGGAGDDCIFASDGNDVVSGGAGNDYIGGELGNDAISGGAGNDYLFGDEGDDRVAGGDGDDYVQGYIGNDVLDGGAGDDFIAGGAGADRLAGGQGSDCFFFYDASDSTPLETDRITDFSSLQGEGNGDDQIDLSSIDANVNLGGDQALVVAGSAAANSLWYEAQASSNGSEDWTFYADTDGNPATVEFELHVHSLAGVVWFDDLTL